MEYLRVPVTDEKAPKERDLAELQARTAMPVTRRPALLLLVLWQKRGCPESRKQGPAELRMLASGGTQCPYSLPLLATCPVKPCNHCSLEDDIVCAR